MGSVWPSATLLLLLGSLLPLLLGVSDSHQQPEAEGANSAFDKVGGLYFTTVRYSINKYYV